MKRKIAFSFLIFASLLPGCKKNQLPSQTEEPKIPIKISSTVTKVSSDEFSDGDAIGLYVVNATQNSAGDWSSSTLQTNGNHLDNVRFTFKEKIWKSDKEYYWKDSRTKADFYCYYPYVQTIDEVKAVAYISPSNQGSKEAFESAEILWGRSELQKPTSESVNIISTHMMSQLIIEVRPGKGFTEETLKESLKSVVINGIMCHAQLDISKGKLTASGDMTDVTPYYDGQYYRALIAPQKIDNKTLITLEVDNLERSLAVSSIEFSSNTRKKCTLTVNKLSEGINVGIGGWEDDENDYGGTLN